MTGKSGLDPSARLSATPLLALLAPPSLDAPRRRVRKERRAREDGPPPDHGGGGNDQDDGRGGGGGGGDGGSGGGAPEPPGTPAGAAEFAFGFLLVAVCTLFLAFLLAWALLRDHDSWPARGALRPPRALWVSTALLVASEGAMVRTARRREARAARKWLGWAALLGALFLAVQGWSWRDLLLGGLTAGSNSYGAVFYSLTGLHALHVLGGLAYMLLLMRRLRLASSSEGERLPVGLGLCRIYWHLMGAIWVVLFVVLYFGR